MNKPALDILKWLAQIEGTVTIHDGVAVDETGMSVDLNQWINPGPELPITTITGTLQGIRVEIWPDRAMRSLYDHEIKQWVQDRLVYPPYWTDEITKLTLGLNPYDKSAAIIALKAHDKARAGVTGRARS